METRQIVQFDVYEDGRIVPVPWDDMTPPDQPPVPMSRQQRRAWERRRRDFLKQYEMHPDVANYRATVATMKAGRLAQHR